MNTLAGIPLSPGMAIGPATTMPAMWSDTSISDESGSPSEQFRSARRAAEAELRCALDALQHTPGPACEILRAHLALLADPMLEAEVESRLARDDMPAIAALHATADALASRFEALADPVMRQRAADLRDICDCIARHLAGRRPADTGRHESRIVCAADLSPGQVIQLAQDRPLAFVLEHGTETSHAAILICAMGVPAVIGVPGATTLVQDGDRVLVDGDSGKVLVHPDSSITVPTVTHSGEPFVSDPRPASTVDGVTIAVSATIADVDDATRSVMAGADGIGLFRTEMLFLRSGRLPTEQEEHTWYSDVARVIGSRRLTVRILDFGADKQPTALPPLHEPNPALGVRGVRWLLTRPELFTQHLRALLRLAAGSHLRLLVPMVVDTTDLVRVREVIDAVVRDIPFALPRIDVGVMIETPAAALLADEMAATADFLSIGTNDLAQYVLAVDRHSPHVASLYQPLHPAVLRLVRDVVAAAARHRTPVSICGEAAADPRAVTVFVGMGVTELSVRPSAIAAVKAHVRRIDAAAARALAGEVAGLATPAAVAQRLGASTSETRLDVRETRDAR